MLTTESAGNAFDVRVLPPILNAASVKGSIPIVIVTREQKFEIRDVAGDSDLLIRNAELGRALAASLGGNAAVLMRGHGSTVVGTSLQQVVYRAIYAETNARLQTQALALGDVTYLNEREAALAAATNDTQLARVWELWTRAVKP